MGYAIYEMNGRDCGYGVPATCDQPGCIEEIDRGMDYACGNEPGGGEQGCGLYFCSTHLLYSVNVHKEASTQLCEPCSINFRLGPDNYKLFAETYEPKPDHMQWVVWKLNAASWNEWRIENPEWVAAMQLRIGKEITMEEYNQFMDGLKRELEEDQENAN